MLIIFLLTLLVGCRAGGGSQDRTLFGDTSNHTYREHGGTVQDLNTGRVYLRSGSNYMIDSQTGQQVYIYGGRVDDRRR